MHQVLFLALYKNMKRSGNAYVSCLETEILPDQMVSVRSTKTFRGCSDRALANPRRKGIPRPIPRLLVIQEHAAFKLVKFGVSQTRAKLPASQNILFHRVNFFCSLLKIDYTVSKLALTDDFAVELTTMVSHC